MGTMLAVLVAAVMPHVRPMDAMAQAAFDRGRTRSRTFARLVQELERSRVIVYVETSLRMRAAVGGQFFFVAKGADGSRYLRIRLNARAGAIDLTARLGHELQHATEVSREAVSDKAGMARLYRVIGEELTLRCSTRARPPGHAAELLTADSALARRRAARDESAGPVPLSGQWSPEA